MSLFSNIVDKIFNAGPKANAATSQGHFVPTLSGTSIPGQPDLSAKPSMAPPPAAQSVDVQARLRELSARQGDKLNWKESIVDLLKLLDLDSSLAARQSLARELNYTGDTNDSAKMNVWLHQQVMERLAKNGGQVPPDLNRKLH